MRRISLALSALLMSLSASGCVMYENEGDYAYARLTTEIGLHRTKNGVKQDMDGYKDKMKPEQIDALVKYMRALAK